MHRPVQGLKPHSHDHECNTLTTRPHSPTLKWHCLLLSSLPQQLPHYLCYFYNHSLLQPTLHHHKFLIPWLFLADLCHTAISNEVFLLASAAIANITFMDSNASDILLYLKAPSVLLQCCLLNKATTIFAKDQVRCHSSSFFFTLCFCFRIICVGDGSSSCQLWNYLHKTHTWEEVRYYLPVHHNMSSAGTTVVRRWEFHHNCTISLFGFTL